MIPNSKNFTKKFGSKLKNFHVYRNMNAYHLFPNLRSLETTINRFDLVDILQLNLRQFEELEITFTEGKEKLFREVLQNIHKIRHLTLILTTNNEKLFFKTLKDSPILQNLIELYLKRYDVDSCVFFVNCLKQMAKKFPNLKKILITNVMDLGNVSDFEQLMSSLKAFPHLKRLDISFENMMDSLFRDFLEFFSFKFFPQELTHLTLLFNYRKVNSKFLKDIDIHLPKLQYLFIRHQIISDEEGVTQMLDILSRLSSLQTINLGILYPISQQIREKFIKKCRKIRNISI